MPPVISVVVTVVEAIGGAAELAALGAGASLATATFIGELTMALVVMAPMYAYNRAQALKAARGTAALNNNTLVIKQSAAARPIVYGRTRVGGLLAFAQTMGSSNEYLYIVVLHAGHECDGIEAFYLNNDQVTLDGSGNVISAIDQYGNAVTRYNGLVTWKTHLGAAGQTVDTFLQSAVGSTVWPNTSTLSGICYSVLSLKYDAQNMSAGLPNVSVLMRGKKVYDPRTSTTAWSQNSALCVRDYLTDANIGFGCATSEIDDTACTIAANHCDESVALLVGGSEARYTCNGVADTSTGPGTILQDLWGSMAGGVSYIGGLFIIRAGAYPTPTITLTETDLRGPISIVTRDSMKDVFNAGKGVYIAADNYYQPSDFPPVAISSYATQDGGVYWRDFQYPYTSSAATAQRLTKISIEAERLDITVSFPATLKNAFNLQAGDTVLLNLPRYGWNGTQPFTVVTSVINSTKDGDSPILGIDLTLRLTNSAVYNWSTTLEASVTQALRASLYNPFGNGPSTPTGLNARSAAAAVNLSWNENPEADFDVYCIYRNTSNSFSGSSQIWSGASLSYDDNSAVFGTTYWYFITGKNTAGWESTPSSGVSGTPGSASTYWIIALGSIRKNISGVFTPATITPSALAQTGSGAPTAYLGRFKIEDTPDGTTWTTRYTSSADESSHTFTPTAGTILIRVSLYQSGGTTNLVDQQLVPITSDGATGATGATGPTGATGSSGYSTAVAYVRAYSAPGTPTGDPVPTGWYASPPSGAGALWQSNATVTTGGVLVGSWSTPNRISGQATWYGTTDPASSYAVLAGDIWFDTSLGLSQVHIKTRDSTNTVWNDATLASISVSQLLAGTISAISIILAAGGSIQSSDYVANVSGILINGSGGGEFNGLLQASKMTTDSMFSNPGYLISSFPSRTTRHGTDSTGWSSLPSTQYSSSMAIFYGWQTGTGYAVDRFGKSDTTFECFLNGGCSAASGSTISINIVYRINGGSWNLVNPYVQSVLPNQSINLAGSVELTGLAGTETIEFAVKMYSPSGSSQVYDLDLTVSCQNV